MTHTDILYEITRYIDPDPVTYSKLALVSRQFYAVFTSDKLWKNLNPYNVDSDYIRTFHDTCDGDYSMVALAWRHTPDFLSNEELFEKIRNLSDNRYAWLGCIVNAKKDTDSGRLFIDYPELISSTIKVFPGTGNLFRSFLNPEDLDLDNITDPEDVPEALLTDEYMRQLMLRDIEACLDYINHRPTLDQAIDLIDAAYALSKLIDPKDEAEIERFSLKIDQLYFHDDILEELPKDKLLRLVSRNYESLRRLETPRDADLCRAAVDSIYTRISKSPWRHYVLNDMPEALRDDYDFVSKLIFDISANNIRYASERIRRDKDLLLRVLPKLELKSDSDDYLSDWGDDDWDENEFDKVIVPELRQDPDVIKAVLALFPDLMEERFAHLNDKFDYAAIAVSRAGFFKCGTIRYATERLQNDRKFVLHVLNMKSRTRHELYNDLEYGGVGIFLQLSPELQTDTEIIDAAVERYGFHKAIPASYWTREKVRRVLERHPHTLERADWQITINFFPKLYMEAQVPHEYVDDKDLMLYAIEKHIENYIVVSKRLKADVDIVRCAGNKERLRKCYKYNPISFWRQIPESVSNNAQLVDELISGIELDLSQLTRPFPKTVAIPSLQKLAKNYLQFPKEWQDDFDFNLESMLRNKQVFFLLPIEMQALDEVRALI